MEDRVYGVFTLENGKRALQFTHGLFVDVSAADRYIKGEGLKDCWLEAVPLRIHPTGDAKINEHDLLILSQHGQVVLNCGRTDTYAAEDCVSDLQPGTYFICRVEEVMDGDGCGSDNFERVV